MKTRLRRNQKKIEKNNSPETLTPFWSALDYDIVELEKKVIFYSDQGFSSRQIQSFSDIPWEKTKINEIIREHKHRKYENENAIHRRNS